MDKLTPHNRGLSLTLKAMMASQAGQDASVIEDLAVKALELLEPWDPIARISTMNTLGRARERQGKTKEAIETLKIAYPSES
jgi:hypothetical protein